MSNVQRAWVCAAFLCLAPSADVFGQAELLRPIRADLLPWRQASERAKLVKTYGGNDASEEAVAAGVRWLALHQKPDGSWSFDHRHGPSKKDQGTIGEAFNGATGLTLMAMLGDGQTHKEGVYKESVKHGLAYLIRSMKLKSEAGLTTGSLADSGTMYSHGVATIALCEAYAMTRDRELMAPAQAAINYIVFSQDPAAGGWRYQAKQPGDTSVTGWQVQALTIGKLAGLTVPDATLAQAGKFLDTVQNQGGAKYGYTSSVPSPGCTASGLYARTLLGWNMKEQEKPLSDGMKFLVSPKPDLTRLYNTYYTSSLLRHHLPDDWKTTYAEIRAALIDLQSREGAEKGSWFVAKTDFGSDQGGRVYCTAMATLILETPYRTYRKPELDDDR